MKIKFIPFIIFFIFFSISTAFAETSIKAEVDKTSLTTDKLLTYKLTITCAERNLPEPKIPQFTGFVVISQAQSSNISFVKGEIKTTLVYTFILKPTNPAKFKIEPSSIKIKNETFSTESFEIEVKPAPTSPEESQPKPETEESQITL